MKKHLLTLVLCCFAICGFAQEHLSFKGIPIEGSMTTFCQKLKSKGFTQIGRDNNITMFTGDFTGRQATVGVGASDDGKNVFSVIVLFDPSGEWNTLVNTYDYYKDLYEKLGLYEDNKVRIYKYLVATAEGAVPKPGELRAEMREKAEEMVERLKDAAETYEKLPKA